MRTAVTQEEHSANVCASGGGPDKTQAIVAEIMRYAPFLDEEVSNFLIEKTNHSQESCEAISPQEQWREVCENLGFRMQPIRSLDGSHYRSEVLLKPVNTFINIPGLGHFEKKYSIPEIIELAEKTGNTFELLEKALEFAFEKASREPESILSVNAYIEDFLEKDPENGRNKLIELVKKLQGKYQEVIQNHIIIEFLEAPCTQEYKDIFSKNGEAQKVENTINMLCQILNKLQEQGFRISLDDIDKDNENFILIILIRLIAKGVYFDELKITGNLTQNLISMQEDITHENIKEKIAEWRAMSNWNNLGAYRAIELILSQIARFGKSTVIEHIENKNELLALMEVIYIIFLHKQETYNTMGVDISWDDVMQKLFIQGFISNQDMETFKKEYPDGIVTK